MLAARELDGYAAAANVSDGARPVLASNDPWIVGARRDREGTANITPMTMMVLAIRLYDVGERDDAVFCSTPRATASSRRYASPTSGARPETSTRR